LVHSYDLADLLEESNTLQQGQCQENFLTWILWNYELKQQPHQYPPSVQGTLPVEESHKILLSKTECARLHGK